MRLKLKESSSRQLDKPENQLRYNKYRLVDRSSQHWCVCLCFYWCEMQVTQTLPGLDTRWQYNHTPIPHQTAVAGFPLLSTHVSRVTGVLQML